MSAPSRLQVVLDGPAVQGVESAIAVGRDGRPVAGYPVLEIAAPGALDASQRTVGTTDAAGRLPWTPTEGGLVALEVSGDRAVIAVHPASKVPGALMGGLCFAILLGAIAWLCRKGWP